MIEQPSGRALLARLRTEPALRLLPLSILVAYLAAIGLEEQSPGYPLALAVRGHVGLMVLAPVAAGCTAWKSGRYRRAGWWRRRWSRSAAVVCVSEVGLTLAVQVAAYGVVRAWVTENASEPVTLSPQPWLVVVALAVLAGAGTLGFVAGRFIRAELVMPVIVVGTYLAMVFPPAMEPLWVRHLTGLYEGCCQRYMELDPGVLRGAAGWWLGLAAALLVGVEVPRRSSVGRSLATGLLAIGLLGGAAMVAVRQVDHLGPEPEAPRTDKVVCAGYGPEVCVWPKQEDDLVKVSQMARGVFRRWHEAGLRVPDRIAPRAMGDRRATLVETFPPRATQDEITWALASVAVPPSTCTTGSRPLFAAEDLARAWVAAAGGMPIERVLESIGTEYAEDLRSLQEAPAASRRRWLDAVERALADSASTVPAVPG